MSVQAPFWWVPMSCGKAMGEGGAGRTNKASLCLHSLRVASAASRPVVNLKSILRFKLQNN